jgi:hypothetical protein
VWCRPAASCAPFWYFWGGGVLLQAERTMRCHLGLNVLISTRAVWYSSTARCQGGGAPHARCVYGNRHPLGTRPRALGGGRGCCRLCGPKALMRSTLSTGPVTTGMQYTSSGSDAARVIAKCGCCCTIVKVIHPHFIFCPKTQHALA